MAQNPTSPVMRPADEDDVLDTSEVPKNEKMFSLKKWNAVAMWSWDVECDVCAICRIQVMGMLDASESFPFDDNDSPSLDSNLSGFLSAFPRCLPELQQ